MFLLLRPLFHTVSYHFLRVSHPSQINSLGSIQVRISCKAVPLYHLTPSVQHFAHTLCSSTPKDRWWITKDFTEQSYLHLCIANFKFSHTSIICDKLPDTDILFGIDIQKRYSQSYSWDWDKQLFIQREGLFLTYTRNCEQQHHIAVVKSPLKTPPRHNGVIPITIKGNSLKALVGYFISNQHINRRLDPSINVVDGIYNIKDRSTLHVLVAKYTNTCTFNAEQCIGHIEPFIDHML